MQRLYFLLLANSVYLGCSYASWLDFPEIPDSTLLLARSLGNLNLENESPQNTRLRRRMFNDAEQATTSPSMGGLQRQRVAPNTKELPNHQMSDIDNQAKEIDSIPKHDSQRSLREDINRLKQQSASQGANDKGSRLSNAPKPPSNSRSTSKQIDDDSQPRYQSSGPTAQSSSQSGRHNRGGSSRPSSTVNSADAKERDVDPKAGNEDLEGILKFRHSGEQHAPTDSANEGPQASLTGKSPKVPDDGAKQSMNTELRRFYSKPASYLNGKEMPRGDKLTGSDSDSERQGPSLHVLQGLMSQRTKTDSKDFLPHSSNDAQKDTKSSTSGEAHLPRGQQDSNQQNSKVPPVAAQGKYGFQESRPGHEGFVTHHHFDGKYGWQEPAPTQQGYVTHHHFDEPKKSKYGWQQSAPGQQGYVTHRDFDAPKKSKYGWQQSAPGQEGYITHHDFDDPAKSHRFERKKGGAYRGDTQTQSDRSKRPDKSKDGLQEGSSSQEPLSLKRAPAKKGFLDPWKEEVLLTHPHNQGIHFKNMGEQHDNLAKDLFAGDPETSNKVNTNDFLHLSSSTLPNHEPSQQGSGAFEREESEKLEGKRSSKPEKQHSHKLEREKSTKVDQGLQQHSLLGSGKQDGKLEKETPIKPHKKRQPGEPKEFTQPYHYYEVRKGNQLPYRFSITPQKTHDSKTAEPRMEKADKSAQSKKSATSTTKASSKGDDFVKEKQDALSSTMPKKDAEKSAQGTKVHLFSKLGKWVNTHKKPVSQNPTRKQSKGTRTGGSATQNAAADGRTRLFPLPGGSSEAQKADGSMKQQQKSHFFRLTRDDGKAKANQGSSRKSRADGTDAQPKKERTRFHFGGKKRREEDEMLQKSEIVQRPEEPLRTNRPGILRPDPQSPVKKATKMDKVVNFFKPKRSGRGSSS